MTFILEGLIVAGILSLSLFTRQGDFHLQCFQVDPETRQESPMGYVTLHRKQHQIRAKLMQWGPQKQELESLTYFAIPDERLFVTVAIFDTPAGSKGHNLVLTRHHTIKNRFALSEGVADPSRLDYCVKIKARQLPKEIR
jgi:hypothetical protein